jgi:ATP-dependent exoDNAse (exonuclease V) alpha subunit
VLLNRQSVTGEDRKLAASYQVGDVIRYARKNDAVGVERGDYATVLVVDRSANRIAVQRQKDGQVVTYSTARAAGVQLYETEERPFAKGERIQFTNPWKEKGIANRDMATITKIDGNGNVTARLDDTGRKVRWNIRDNAHIDHGYATTSYSAQAKTVDRVLIHVETGDARARALVDQTLAYVATSRGRYDAQFFVDDREQLAKSLESMHLKPKALSREQIEAYKEQQSLSVAVA